MASLKTDALNNLASVEEPDDTDLIPVGTGSGNVLKKLTVANMITWLKEKLGVNSLSTKVTNLSNKNNVEIIFSGMKSNETYTLDLSSHAAYTQYMIFGRNMVYHVIRYSSSLAISEYHTRSDVTVSASGLKLSIKATTSDAWFTILKINRVGY